MDKKKDKWLGKNVRKSILEEIKVLDVPELNIGSRVLGRWMDSGCSDDEVFSGRNCMKFIDTESHKSI